MYFYWVKTTALIRRIFRNYIWEIPNSQNIVYLTFDDGPTPEITFWILDQLKKNDVKATFFCVGENIKRYPEIAKKIIEEGHLIANHTHTHPNGWTTNTEKYIENVILCENAINEIQPEVNPRHKLFRPPYGKLKISQSKILRNMGYKIIMWDILTADFLQEVEKEQCLKNVTKNANSGSIIVFHDNPKAYKNLEYALPKAIEFLKEKGYGFDKINL